MARCPRVHQEVLASLAPALGPLLGAIRDQVRLRAAVEASHDVAILAHRVHGSRAAGEEVLSLAPAFALSFSPGKRARVHHGSLSEVVPALLMGRHSEGPVGARKSAPSAVPVGKASESSLGEEVLVLQRLVVVHRGQVAVVLL